MLYTHPAYTHLYRRGQDAQNVCALWGTQISARLATLSLRDRTGQHVSVLDLQHICEHAHFRKWGRCNSDFVTEDHEQENTLLLPREEWH